MGAVVRGWRNVFRSKARFGLVMVVLALSAGITITMAQVSLGIRDNVRAVGADYLTFLEVRKAGATGMGVGVDALPEDLFARASSLPGVVGVEEYLFQRMVYPERAASISIVVGVGKAARPRLALHGELNSPRIVAGRGLSPEDEGTPVAVVGKAFAEYFNLAPGAKFTLKAENVKVQDRPGRDFVPEDMAITVIGIFESGFVFGDNQLFMPLGVVQRFAQQEGKISHIYVRAASVDQVQAVEEALWEAFEGQADVISGQYLAAKWATALRALESQSLLAAGVAAGAGALVALFIMMLVTHERTREIGILKAIGATNGDVATQFAAESASIALLGGLLGLVVFTVAGARVTNVLLGVAASTSITPATAMGGEDPTSGLVFSYALSWPVVGATLALVLFLALVGSLYAVLRAIRLRPVEAIRTE